MKLKNKKTGELATLTLSTNGEDMIIMGNDMYAHITKLSELKDYEDYEEPKEYWYINASGEVNSICEEDEDEEDTKSCEEIGNHFSSREEAEKAVEKLKAITRLKDKKFRFDGYDVAHKSNGNLAGQIFYDAGNYSIEDVEKEMDLLFGGEE